MNRLAQQCNPQQEPILTYVVRWVFTNDHVWTKVFYTMEEAQEWVRSCELTNDPNIKHWSINEEVC